MRIIAGAFRGRKLKTPKGMDTRPTQDRVREMIFNILQNYGIRNSAVLDCFAGTGAMGLEALSRGAQSLVAIDFRTATLVAENASLCGVNEKVSIWKTPFEKVLPRLENEQFDLIFSDPPYNKGYMQKTVDTLVKANCVKDGAIIVLEYDKEEAFTVPTSWDPIKERTVGYTVISFYKKIGQGGE